MASYFSSQAKTRPRFPAGLFYSRFMGLLFISSGFNLVGPKNNQRFNPGKTDPGMIKFSQAC